MQINHCCSHWEMLYLWFSKDNYWVSQWHMFQGHTVLFNVLKLWQLTSLPWRLPQHPFGQENILEKTAMPNSLSLSCWTRGNLALFFYRLCSTHECQASLSPYLCVREHKTAEACTVKENLPQKWNRPGEEIKHRQYLVNFKLGHCA